MIYPIKTLTQLPLVLKGFRKEKGLTQAAMAGKLGISQQSYGNFEANPASAALGRLFMVLRLLDVEISLNQTSPGAKKGVSPTLKVATHQASKREGGVLKVRKIASRNKKSSSLAAANAIASSPAKKESW